MKRHTSVIGSHTGLWTMMLSAGVLAVLLLAGTAAGATWVVDDDGGAGVDYTTIQAAVAAASDGDTIEVRSGTYYENVDVDKQLILRGIDTGAGMPVVNGYCDGWGDGGVITLRANGCVLNGFVVMWSGGWGECAGIVALSDDNMLTNNNVSNHYGGYGIYLEYSNNNTLTSNTANSNNDYGIHLYHSSNNTLTDNNASNNYWGGYGIYLEYSSNNTLSDNVMSGNTYNFGVRGDNLSEYVQNIDTSNKVDGKPIYYWVNQQDQQISADAGYVGVVDCTNIVVRDLTLTNNYQGVLFAYTENSRIENVIVSSNDDGIYLYSSSGNTLQSNTANSNNNGICIESSSDNMLQSNTASDNRDGIRLSHSSNNMLQNNIVKSNDWWYGIYLEYSNNNILTDNNASNNSCGIYLESSSDNTLSDNTMSGNGNNFGVGGNSLSHYTQNMDTSNEVDGKPIYYWVNQQDQQIPADAGYVGVVDCTNIVVRDLTLTNNYQGVLFAYTENSRIENVAASNNRDGIRLSHSSNNMLQNNIIASNNSYGIYLESSNDNMLSGNIVLNNWHGIYLYSSSDNTLSDNTAMNNYQGICLSGSSDNMIESNTANSNNGCGIELGGSSNNTLQSNTANSNYYWGIDLYGSSNNTLTDNNASNNRAGIYLMHSSDNTIQNNIANSNNDDGIYIHSYMYSSNGNTVTGNIAANNEYGIRIYSYSLGSSNIIYHNNLVDNTNHNAHDDGTSQWDSGSEGNYYGDDYTGTDSDGDGIGDTPYTIPGGGSSVDRYPLMAPYTPHTGPSDKSLVQVEGQPEVHWFQNGRLYWVTDWNVINDMSGVPGWDGVNTLPASEFDPATYPQGPRFITTGAESNDLLIREQGDVKVYLILNGEKHHFTSPEALTWNGYGFDDVIEVSSTIVGMFPEGTPISIQEKHLLRKPGGTHVFWSQNGELYYVTADALDKMLNIHGWGWDEINEPADFNPEDPSHYKTFITTDPESNGVLIRLWDGYKVYRIEDGFRRHITYPEVMELKGYAMEDVIDVSQEIMDMFPLGDPIGIEVNLTFNKTTDAGEEPCTKFTTGETVRFYTETTVSESYTVDTYVKLTEPDGRTRYAYHTNPDFQPTDPLSFSDTEVPLYPGHWDAVSKDWNWHEYVFDNDAEGVYTWEFYYRDVISGKVLGWDRKSYVFAKKTALGLELTISTNKDMYGENEPIIIFADVHDSNGNDVVVNKNDFEVHLDNFPQEFELEQVCSIHGNCEITGLKAPGPSLMGNKIDVSVKTGAGNAFDTETIRVGGYTTYAVLMILACPKDLYNDTTGKPNVDDWYNSDHGTGTPDWYKNLETKLSNYYWDISYNHVMLDFETTDQWFKLPENDSDYTPFFTCVNDICNIDNMRKLREHAVNEAEASGHYQISEYDLIVVIDPTNIVDNSGKWNGNAGLFSIDFSNTPPEPIIISSTPYNDGDNANEVIIDLIDHEITHAIDFKDDGQNVINKNQGDNNDPKGPCIMCPNNKGEHQPFCPINGKKMGFSDYMEEVDLSGLGLKTRDFKLYSTEAGNRNSIHVIKKNVLDFDAHRSPPVHLYDYHYYIEFRDGTWEAGDPSVLIWLGKEDGNLTKLPNADHPKLEERIYSDQPDKRKYYSGWRNQFCLGVMRLTDIYADIRIISGTDSYDIANRKSTQNYEINISVLGTFFDDEPYNFSVIDTTDQSEVFNSTLTTNPEGFFDSPITFNDTITDNIEAHSYLIRVHTASGWVPFLIATPALIDGISNETPFFTASDPAETNTAGDLTNLTSTCGSMKLSLKTAAPVDTDSYRYVIYLDSDNSSSTGSIVNSIGADYKIEYSDAGAGLYRYNTSWTLVDTPYLNASHNGTNIEILTTTEIMNGTDTVKLVAQTFDSSDTLHDTLPDPTSTPPYLEFMDVHPMDMRFAEYGYYAGDNVTVNGYGFAQNQMIPITIMNQTGHVLWNGSVQANSDGQVINVSTYTVPDDFYGTSYLYWAGAQMDSFSRLTPSLPVYNAEFELDAPMVAGVGREFNVTVGFENIGDDLTNLTLNLNTSGMTSEPETVWIGDLTSGQNYTYTWNLTPTCSGFALLKAEVCSNQSTFVTDQKGIYIANVSVEIDAPNGTQCGNTVEFNVSVTNNQENITYTDLMINTSIKEIETNFTQQVIALPPGQVVNQSYLWDTANVTPGTYRIMVDIVSNGVVLSSGESSVVVNETSFPRGDLDHDGNITSADVRIALRTAFSGEYTSEADIDANGCVNALDARMIMQAAAGRIEL